MKNWAKWLIALPLLYFMAPVTIETAVLPITLQTLILFSLAGWLGGLQGFLMSAIYLATGAMGAPIFADHTHGWQKMTGHTAGFLWAFPLGCLAIGYWCKYYKQQWLWLIVGFSLCHCLIFIPGFWILKVQIPQFKIVPALLDLIPALLVKSLIGGTFLFLTHKLSFNK